MHPWKIQKERRGKKRGVTLGLEAARGGAVLQNRTREGNYYDQEPVRVFWVQYGRVLTCEKLTMGKVSGLGAGAAEEFAGAEPSPGCGGGVASTGDGK